jgi:hypothetical protein
VGVNVVIALIGSDKFVDCCISSNPELDRRFGPTPCPNFEPDFGQVLKGSGLNCGSELDLGISTKEAMERNEHFRATWQVVVGQYDTCQLVFVDEAGVDDHTNIRKNGWAPLGQACVRRTTFLQGRKYSILPALSCDGIFALDIFEGSVNCERFINFLCNHLV